MSAWVQVQSSNRVQVWKMFLHELTASHSLDRATVECGNSPRQLLTCKKYHQLLWKANWGTVGVKHVGRLAHWWVRVLLPVSLPLHVAVTPLRSSTTCQTWQLNALAVDGYFWCPPILRQLTAEMDTALSTAIGALIRETVTQPSAAPCRHAQSAMLRLAAPSHWLLP